MTKPMLIQFSNTYSKLGDAFFQRVNPEKTPLPTLILWNESLAAQLDFKHTIQINDAEQAHCLAGFFSGNEILPGAEPIALAYSGHQFGHFNPQLGDGRAHLLGEVIDKRGVRWDMQLKGSGKTPFSRRGDGKCALAPALREYIMSEAMFALGVPTSRCLAVTCTGEKIYRETLKHGAVLTRIASSHIRVGTFQYFVARGDLTSATQLLDYAIERHYPDINELKAASDEQRILQFLTQVSEQQIHLVVHWLRVGFIHGVMNTDNTAISGETIDFGPCAMLGNYHQAAVFSSIDEYGRYAFAKQASIMQWNMARLADCMLPLLLVENKKATEQETETREQEALAKVEKIIHAIGDKFEAAYYAMYAAKLGFTQVNEHVKQCITELLTLMQEHALDYTLTFANLTQGLTDSLAGKTTTITSPKPISAWLDNWQQLLNRADTTLHYALLLMQKNNPVVIPRNHHVEAILARCEQALNESQDDVLADTGQEASLLDFTKINAIVDEFLTVLRSPYQSIKATAKYQDAPVDNDQNYQTFCGT